MPSNTDFLHRGVKVVEGADTCSVLTHTGVETSKILSKIAAKWKAIEVTLAWQAGVTSIEVTGATAFTNIL